MKILIDINHPAHVHFFKNSIKKFKKSGFEVIVVSRDKDVTANLLYELGIDNICMSHQKNNKISSFVRELVSKDFNLLKLARKEKPDIMLSIGGTFISHVGFLLKIPSLVFYDTENAVLQNLITYPFSYKVITPISYKSWLPKKSIKYNGYHELSYLHPNYFTPDKKKAKLSGLVEGKPNILVRIVSWNANHDLNESGIDEKFLLKICNYLDKKGNVILSSEGILPTEFDKYLYRGKVSDLHHLLAFCSLCIGESATLASEASVLGVPSIYIAKTGRGYTDEQERRYGLVKNIKIFSFFELKKNIDQILSNNKSLYAHKKYMLLNNSIDVTEYIYYLVKKFSRSNK